MLENYTTTENSNNRFRFLESDPKDEIVIGGTCMHVFVLPFVYSSVATRCKIIYNQGIETVLEKSDQDCEIIEDRFCTKLLLKLQPLETLKFKFCCLETAVQIKVVSNQNEILYTEKNSLCVKNPLDYGKIDFGFKSIKYLDQFLYETEYEEFDYKFANDYFNSVRIQPNIFGCSSVRSGDFYGRNFDWFYDYSASFIVKAPRTKNHYASIGVAGGITELTDEFLESGEYSDKYKLVPFMMLDGINEHGVFCNTNIVHADHGITRDSVPTAEKTAEICNISMVRYILDNFRTAKSAAEYIREHVDVYTLDTLAEMDYDIHIMVGDASNTYVIEFLDEDGIRRACFKEQDKMTNFYVNDVSFNEDGTVYTPETQDAEHNAEITNHITANGCGLERWNLIVSEFDNANSRHGMRKLLTDLFYTNSYTNRKWCTEFVGLHGLTVSSSYSEYAQYFDLIEDRFKNRSREEGKSGTWHTTHSCVYNLKDKEFYVVCQEKAQKEYTVKLLEQ